MTPEEFAIKVLGQEVYDNSPCQAHAYELVAMEIEHLRNEVEALRAALQKVLDDSEIGVVPRAHLNYIEQLLRGEGE